MVTVTKYVWDPVSDCVLMELDETDNVKAVYTNEARQYGGVLSQRRGNTSHYHHHDALGSTRFLTDSTGNVTDTYLNDAWGNSVASTGTTVNPFKWVGKYGYYTDNSTGQVYVRARMYQPATARWYSVDPLMFLPLGRSVTREIWSADHSIPVLWGYTRNNSASSIDPSGLVECKVKVCSSPVPGTHNRGGHLFVICDGEAMRAGPGERGQFDHPDDVVGAVGCFCEETSKNSPYGRLIPTIGLWTPGFVDHPDPGPGRDGKPQPPIYPSDELKCVEVAIEGPCSDVCDCLRERFLALWKCCIVYDPFPDLKNGNGDADGNSNSAVVWAWKGCMRPKNPLRSSPPTPNDGKLEPGQLQLVPPCIEKAAPGREPLFRF